MTGFVSVQRGHAADTSVMWMRLHSAKTCTVDRICCTRDAVRGCLTTTVPASVFGHAGFGHRFGSTAQVSKRSPRSTAGQLPL